MRARARAQLKKLNADTDNYLLQNGDLRLSREGEIAIIRTALFHSLDRIERTKSTAIGARSRAEPRARTRAM